MAFMALFQKKKKTRTCVIGLDGVPYSLLLELAERGTMPSLADLLKAGHLHRMKASLPEISSVSWTDFMTGTNSGEHGIFGFTDLKPGSYALRFPNFLYAKRETIWDILGKKVKKSIVLNQPSTYPARPLNGIMVSGFVAIDLAKAVEQGMGHTAVIHSKHLDVLSRMSREINTSIFVKNGPCMAGLGYGGEGYASMSIASPTGEGMTNALTFTRVRRCTMVDHFRIV